MSLAEQAPPTGRRRTPGEVGIWVFIGADLVLFSLLFGTALYYRAQDEAAYVAGSGQLHSGYALLNTIVLLAGSLLVVTAVRVARAGRSPSRALLAAAACGVLFTAIKSGEYVVQLQDGRTAFTDPFFGCFFVITGIHLVHVVTGVLVLWWLARRLRDGTRDADDVMWLENGASYWHMVDLLWLVLFPLFYVVG